MANQEQGPAASDPCRHPLHHLLDRPGYVDIQADHKVVLVPLRRPGREIGLDPVDALGDVRPDGLGRRPGMCQGRRGEVNRGDLPSARSEPKRVGPVAAARVESASGRQVADLGGQMGVRAPLRHAIPVLAQRLRPALFPEVPVVLAHVGRRRQRREPLERLSKREFLEPPELPEQFLERTRWS